MSTRRKGNATQRRAIRYLEINGWFVDKVEKTGKFCKIKDLFGLFDLICVRPGEILFVQVKTNQPASQKPLKEFCEKYKQEGLCMTWYDRVGWVFHYYKKDGSITKIDIRK